MHEVDQALNRTNFEDLFPSSDTDAENAKPQTTPLLEHFDPLADSPSNSPDLSITPTDISELIAKLLPTPMPTRPIPGGSFFNFLVIKLPFLTFLPNLV